MSALTVLQACGVGTVMLGLAYLLVTDGAASTVIGVGQVVVGVVMAVSARVAARRHEE